MSYSENENFNCGFINPIDDSVIGKPVTVQSPVLSLQFLFGPFQFDKLTVITLQNCIVLFDFLEIFLEGLIDEETFFLWVSAAILSSFSAIFSSIVVLNSVVGIP